MTKIRDIINNGADELEDIGLEIGEWYIDIDDMFNPKLVAFYTTFDPEHVALMENVIEAYRDADCPRPANCADCLMAKPCAMFNALETHRRKHGLV
jgi:hypothetical protein